MRANVAGKTGVDQEGTTLTDGLEGHVGEGGAVVVVEQPLQHVERDVGEAGVHVGVDGQDDGVGAQDAARHDVSLSTHTRTHAHIRPLTKLWLRYRWRKTMEV